MLGVGEVQLDGGSLGSERQLRRSGMGPGELLGPATLGRVYPVLGSCLTAGAGDFSTSNVLEVS